MHRSKTALYSPRRQQASIAAPVGASWMWTLAFGQVGLRHQANRFMTSLGGRFSVYALTIIADRCARAASGDRSTDQCDELRRLMVAPGGSKPRTASCYSGWVLERGERDVNCDQIVRGC
jgi:hypothetical protein